MSGLPDTEHVLIVQDDVVLASGFAEAVHQIGQTHPRTPVCLFIAKYPRDTKPRVEAALKMNRRYVALSWRSFLPVVAVLWPTHKLLEFREWAEQNPRLPAVRIAPRSDDAVGGRWKMLTRQHVLATVPSIVEHPDIEPSTIRAAMAGKDRGRCAAVFADNALDYDWSKP